MRIFRNISRIPRESCGLVTGENQLDSHKRHGDGVAMRSITMIFAVAWTVAAETAAAGETTSLFNGKDLAGWHADVPAKDKNPDSPASFVVRDGMLVSMGKPPGHLITDKDYADYTLEVEYRFAKQAGNCGVLVHASTPRKLSEMFPQSLEVQMQSGNAGDFWCIGENIEVPDMEKRRPHKDGQAFGGGAKDARRILNLTDDSEKPVGEWNTMRIVCKADTITVWVNGVMVNAGTRCTAKRGKIALQAEGSEVEFRKLELTPLAARAD